MHCSRAVNKSVGEQSVKNETRQNGRVTKKDPKKIVTIVSVLLMGRDGPIYKPKLQVAQVQVQFSFGEVLCSFASKERSIVVQ